MNKRNKEIVLCTGRKMVADLVKDCNKCMRFRSTMIVDSERSARWKSTKPNSKEYCGDYLSNQKVS